MLSRKFEPIIIKIENISIIIFRLMCLYYHFRRNVLHENPNGNFLRMIKFSICLPDTHFSWFLGLHHKNIMGLMYYTRVYLFLFTHVLMDVFLAWGKGGKLVQNAQKIRKNLVRNLMRFWLWLSGNYSWSRSLRIGRYFQHRSFISTSSLSINHSLILGTIFRQIFYDVISRSPKNK